MSPRRNSPQRSKSSLIFAPGDFVTKAGHETCGPWETPKPGEPDLSSDWLEVMVRFSEAPPADWTAQWIEQVLRAGFRSAALAKRAIRLMQKDRKEYKKFIESISEHLTASKYKNKSQKKPAKASRSGRTRSK